MIDFIIDLFRKKPPSATDKLFYKFANCKEIEAHYDRFGGLFIIESEIGTLAFRDKNNLEAKCSIGYFNSKSGYIDGKSLHVLRERPSNKAEKAFMKAFEENLYGGILK